MSEALASRRPGGRQRVQATTLKHLGRWLLLLLLCAVALQLFFLLRVAMMAVVDPQSTSFQRSEIWRLLQDKPHFHWRQHWVGAERISPQLGRAVIASEDAGFADHGGVDWSAIQGAWHRNQRAQQVAAQREAATNGARAINAKIVGGSTISQQLAKNLFLSGERTTPRKAQELLITFMLEGLLSKERLLAIYLNNVEWGEGVFGAQAAAQRYFQADAAQLSPAMAARLAVMLPAPKRFEKLPQSPYVSARTATIVARMPSVKLP